MHYYFAYGSNMNPTRVRERIGAIRSVQAASLPGYRLVFNKQSRVPGIAHANIMPYDTREVRVEGALYELQAPEQIELMDPFEGCPHDYTRTLMTVCTHRMALEAWVYIGQPEQLAEGLKPAAEYLRHLLAGAPFLSPDYYQWLQATECISHLPTPMLRKLGL